MTTDKVSYKSEWWFLDCQWCGMPALLDNSNKFECQSMTCIGCNLEICKKCGGELKGRGLRHMIKDESQAGIRVPCPFMGYQDKIKFKNSKEDYDQKYGVMISVYIF